MNNEGLFIVFEGPEGSGKTTQSVRLYRHLKALGHSVVSRREPGGTPVGELIREILLQEDTPEEDKVEVPMLTEFFLFLASRSAFVAQFVHPALKDGTIVIADRFDLSTLAYQVAGRLLPIGPAIIANNLAKDDLEPDIVILLKVSYEEGRRRQQRQGKEKDRIEAESEEYHRRVHSGYDRFSLSLKNHVTIDTNDLDADEVFEQVRQAVNELLERREHAPVS